MVGGSVESCDRRPLAIAALLMSSLYLSVHYKHGHLDETYIQFSSFQSLTHVQLFATP